ncbi:MAG: hypothetical protein SOT60_09675 [Bilifractor sp.]|nr:hypothetical protein [Lachnospiraceae bacterium]MDY2838186.1 hypothetical protein [Bilifractor sp.]
MARGQYPGKKKEYKEKDKEKRKTKKTKKLLTHVNDRGKVSFVAAMQQNISTKIR